MQRAPEYASTDIDIGSSQYQEECGLAVVLPDGEAKGRAEILVEDVGVNFLVHKEALNDAFIAHESGLVEDSPLSVVSLVLVEIVLREVLQEGHQGAFLHFVLQKQALELEQGVKQESARLGLAIYLRR